MTPRASDVEESVAILGAGPIGCAWAIVFARAGRRVAWWSRTHASLARGQEWIGERLSSLRDYALLGETPEAIAARIEPTNDLATAVRGVGYVQESIPEALEAKRALFAELDGLAAPEAVLASSTSTLPASQFAAHLKTRQRCLVAHPVNPPYLVPAVEICPAPFTAGDTLKCTRALLASVGQAPIVLKKEIAGFVMNRLQGLIACEAVRLVEGGYVDVEDLDRAVKDGLGLRWSFMGPLETLDLNAAGGFAQFAQVFAPIMHAIDASPEAAPKPWSEAVIHEIDAQRRERVPLAAHGERMLWRDRMLMALVAYKRALQAPKN